MLVELARWRQAIILLELDGSAVAAPARFVREVKARFPMAHVVGYCRLSVSACRIIVDAVREGLDDLVIAGDSDVAETINAVAARHAATRALTDVRDLLRGRLHRVAAPVAEVLLAGAPTGASVNLVARALGCTPRTLARRFAQNGLGSPGWLVSLLRWMSVAAALTAEGRSTSEAAAGAGYANARAMRAALKRGLNVSVAQLRDADFAAALWEEVLELYGTKDRSTRSISDA